MWQGWRLCHATPPCPHFAHFSSNGTSLQLFFQKKKGDSLFSSLLNLLFFLQTSRWGTWCLHQSCPSSTQTSSYCWVFLKYVSDWVKGNVRIETMSLCFPQSLGSVRYMLWTPCEHTQTLNKGSWSCLSSVWILADLSMDGIWDDDLWTLLMDHVMLTESPSSTAHDLLR